MYLPRPAKPQSITIRSRFGIDLDSLAREPHSHIANTIIHAQSSGLAKREAKAPLNPSKEDMLLRRQLDDTVPRSVYQLDNYNTGATTVYYIMDGELLRMDLGLAGSYLRVCAELADSGQLLTVLHSITRSTVGADGSIEAWNGYDTVTLSVKDDGSITWSGEAFKDARLVGKLVNRSDAKLLKDLFSVSMPRKTFSPPTQPRFHPPPPPRPFQPPPPPPQPSQPPPPPSQPAPRPRSWLPPPPPPPPPYQPPPRESEYEQVERIRRQIESEEKERLAARMPEEPRRHPPVLANPRPRPLPQPPKAPNQRPSVVPNPYPRPLPKPPKAPVARPLPKPPVAPVAHTLATPPTIAIIPSTNTPGAPSTREGW